MQPSNAADKNDNINNAFLSLLEGSPSPEKNDAEIIQSKNPPASINSMFDGVA